MENKEIDWDDVIRYAKENNLYRDWLYNTDIINPVIRFVKKK